MTVNAVLAELEKLRDKGFGEDEVRVEVTTAYSHPVQSVDWIYYRNGTKAAVLSIIA
jgi:hypothetical protein